MTIRSKVPTKSYRDNFDQIDWSASKDHTMAELDCEERARAPMVIHDIQPFKAPDGTIIKSRKARDRYMKSKGLCMADDFAPSHFEAKAKERQQRLNGEHPEQKRDRIEKLRDAYEHVRDKSRYYR